MYKVKFLLFFVAIMVVIGFGDKSYAENEKTVVILVDELKLKDIREILGRYSYGIGLINTKTRNSDVDESIYFSIALGRKVAVSSYYSGLYKGKDGRIYISGYKEMLNSISIEDNRIDEILLGERLKDQGISYIGNNPSAVLAADSNGVIHSGEIEINYNRDWLLEKTEYHLKNSNILILSYKIDNMKNRLNVLKEYISNIKDNRILIIPISVSEDMDTLFNDYIVPIVYIEGNKDGLLTSSSTKREGFIVLEDIYGHLVSIYDEIYESDIGNEIQIVEKEDNIKSLEELFKNTNNLMYITYMFHGALYLLQVYSGYMLYRRRYEHLNRLNYLYTFAVINIFIGLLMAASSYHINIALYISVNLLISYIITALMYDNRVDNICLFSLLSYGIIIIQTLFYPNVIYSSPVGMNNIFYGARYYGYNNGMMAVLVATSILGYLFIKRHIENELISKFIFMAFLIMNISMLSSGKGANTGGFITASVLFIMALYCNFLKKNWNINVILSLALFAVLLFGINMYFDFLSHEKSHAIKFLMRIKYYGIKEFMDMAFIKFVELIKLTFLPPYSLTILSQIIILNRLKGCIHKNIKDEIIMLFISSIVAFLINDTGNIAFIFMNHYLISLLINEYHKSDIMYM